MNTIPYRDKLSLADLPMPIGPGPELAASAFMAESIARESLAAPPSMPSTLLQTASDDAATHILRAERALQRGELERFYHHARMVAAAHTTIDAILAPLKSAASPDDK